MNTGTPWVAGGVNAMASMSVAAAWSALVAAESAMACELPAEIVDSCRPRICMILGATEPAREVAHAPGCVAAGHRVATAPFLTFAEQFVADVNAVSDEMVRSLCAELPADRVYLFVRWVQAFEACRRAELLLAPPSHASPYR